jgi:DNA-binding NarL/FixJ family response regulator
LDSLAQEARQGRGAVVLVEGPAGIGKTRLVADGLERAELAGVATSYGRCHEVGTIAPLSPLLAALSSGPAPVLQRDELRALERPGDQRFWLLEELSEILERRSRQKPRLLALDDLQWADPATAWAVQALTQRTFGLPVGWVFALRPHPLPAALQRLVTTLASVAASRLTLGALEPTDVDGIAADVLGGEPDVALRRYLAGAGGNPFLVLELLRTLTADDMVRVVNGVTVLSAAGVPGRFRETVRERLAGLSPVTVGLLQAGSVLGRPFTSAEAAAVLDMAAGVLLGAFTEAIEGDVLVDTDGVLAFKHDLLRQAIHDDMPSSARTLLHRRTATVLLETGSANEAASHLLVSAQPGDQEAARALFQAAGATATQAPSAAADLAARAVELMTPNQLGWSNAVVVAVSLLAWASRFADAEALAARARAAGLDRTAAGAMRLAIADMLMLSARRIELIEMCQQALTEPDLSPTMRGHFLHNLGNGYITDGQAEKARQTFQAALNAIGTEDPTLALSARIGLAHVEMSIGRLAAALDRIDELIDLCVAAGPEGKQRMPWLLRATIFGAVDRFDAADEDFAEARSQAEALGATWAVEFTQRVVTAARWWAGRLPDAAAEAEATLSLIEALDLGHDADVPIGILALVSVHANDLPTARMYLQRAGSRRYAFSVPQYLQLANAMLCDAENDHDGSLAALRRLTERNDGLVATLAQEPSLAPVYARLALRARGHAVAEHVVVIAEQMSSLNPSLVSHQVAANHAAGLLHRDLERLLAAADGARAAPRLLARASALEDAGRTLVRHGDAPKGARYLNDALDVYASIDASRDELRVRGLLRAAGVRRRPAPARAEAVRDPSPLGALTSAERRVVRLVTDGLTNREIGERLYLSPYTVGTHLKHVFEKLHISSRVELTRIAVATSAD